jgi:hypothetical protein
MKFNTHIVPAKEWGCPDGYGLFSLFAQSFFQMKAPAGAASLSFLSQSAFFFRNCGQYDRAK